MADVHTPEQRSRNMAAIKSRGNVTTELSMVKLFRQNKITGWRRHLKNLPGKPDFAFPDSKTAVFVDGCFWHGCKRCGLKSKSNRQFWKKKTDRNIERDKENNRELRKMGWGVMRIWEHEIKRDPHKVIAEIERMLDNKK